MRLNKLLSQLSQISFLRNYIFPESIGDIGLNLSRLNLHFAGILPDQNTATNTHLNYSEYSEYSSELFLSLY